MDIEHVELNDKDEYLKVLIAFCLDEIHNHRQRELHWYGPWTYVLTVFTDITSTILHPQYPLWETKEEDEDASAKANPALSSEFSESPGNASQKLSSGPSSPIILTLPISFDHSSNSPPSTPVREAIESNVLQPSNTQPVRNASESPESASMKALATNFKLTMAMKLDREKNLSTEAKRGSKKLPPLTHKVPDFVIIHLKYRQDNKAIDPFYKISDRIVPVLVEVKTYHYKDRDHQNVLNTVERLGRMVEARIGLEKQVEYLFSFGGQAAVVAIATSGHFWSWKHFALENGKIVSKSKGPNHQAGVVDDDGWSGELQLGTLRSKKMLLRIRQWAEQFIDQYDNTQLSIIVDPE